MADDKREQPRPEAAPENAAQQTPASEKPATAAPERAASERPSPEPSLGKTIAAARERRGLSQAAVAKDAHIPPYYVRMIENDDYTLISDQLYLLPFLRRYATFVGLDPEEVASRFIRDVQRADVSAARMSEPIPMANPRKRRHRLKIAVILIAVIAAALLAGLGYRALFQPRKSGLPEASAVPTAASATNAPVVAPAVPAVPVAPGNAETPAPRSAPPAARPSGPQTVPRPAIP